jgi:hypothetical protein
MIEKLSMKLIEEANKKLLEQDNSKPPLILANRKSPLHPLNWFQVYRRGYCNRCHARPEVCGCPEGLDTEIPVTQALLPSSLMPNPPIPPALTEDEWKIGMTDRHPEEPWGDVALSGGGVAITGVPYYTPIENRHACAALCLYDQTFGFTHEDVKLLRLIADGRGVYPGINVDLLADRIAALLPPPPE